MNKAVTFFAGAVVLQLALLAAVPAPKIHARYTGKTVILKTAPIDPYSVMSGYFVTLSYDISRMPEHLKDYHYRRDKKEIYVVVEEIPDDPNGVWKAVSYHESFPEKLASPKQAVIKGRNDGWRITFGIEDYYIPEGMRTEIDDALRANNREARVVVKVASNGEAALVRLLVGTKTYDY